MRSRIVRAGIAAGVLFGPFDSANAAGPDLIGPFDSDSAAVRISGDGSFLVGVERLPSGLHLPYRWSVDEPAPELLFTDVFGIPYDVSTDGGFVVGDTLLALPGGGSSSEAFRWTAEGGVEHLGYLPPGAGHAPESRARGVSADGSVVVGYSTVLSYDHRAFRWTEAGGIEDLGVLPEHEISGSPSSFANDVSNDGGTIVGASFLDNVFVGSVAVKWTAAGIEALPDLPGGIDEATAQAVSADGSVVVGSGHPTDRQDRPKATRWVNGVVEDLGDLPGNAVRSEAFDVSADGEVVVGQSAATGGLGGDGLKAFLWTGRTGMRSVEQVLTNDFGLDLGGTLFERAVSVSDDGLHIVVYGAGDHYVARIPYLPGHPACDDHEDDDGDGLVDFPDDPGCQSADSQIENPKCDNDLDDDGDGKIDWDGGPGAGTPDPQCVAAPWNDKEAKSGCGVGAEIALALALIGVAGGDSARALPPRTCRTHPASRSRARAGTTSRAAPSCRA